MGKCKKRTIRKRCTIPRKVIKSKTKTKRRKSRRKTKRRKSKKRKTNRRKSNSKSKRRKSNRKSKRRKTKHRKSKRKSKKIKTKRKSKKIKTKRKSKRRNTKCNPFLSRKKRQTLKFRIERHQCPLARLILEKINEAIQEHNDINNVAIFQKKLFESCVKPFLIEPDLIMHIEDLQEKNNLIEKDSVLSKQQSIFSIFLETDDKPFDKIIEKLSQEKEGNLSQLHKGVIQFIISSLKDLKALYQDLLDKLKSS